MTPVGVFVNPTTEEVVFAAEAAGIRVAQIHGDVPAWLGGIAPVTILRAVHLAAGDAGDIEPAVGGVAPVLLDAHDPVRHGGTGQTRRLATRAGRGRARGASCWPAG